MATLTYPRSSLTYQMVIFQLVGGLASGPNEKETMLREAGPRSSGVIIKWVAGLTAPLYPVVPRRSEGVKLMR